MRIKTQYLMIAIVVFVLEVMIATTFSHFRAVRGSLSDLFVVIFIYCLMRAFWDIAPSRLSAYVLLFACAVEISQYFHLADSLGLRRGSLLSILMGNTFSLIDILMYFLGCLFSYLSDTFFLSKRTRQRA